MYPDTDTPPVPIPDEMVGRVQARMPERPWEKEARFLAMGLDAATARRLVDAPWCALFEELAPEPGALARRIAFALEKRLPHWRRGNGSLELPTVERLRPWADALREGRVRPETCEPILDLLLRDAAPTNAVLEHFAHGKDDESIIEQALAALAESTSELHAREEGPALRWAMGRLMPKLLGRADPDELQRRAKEVLPQGDAR
jgi:aspartyl-tRNA(Asn)/glutamyl-tRNA(Gln) amidotransferase subunit B